MSHELEIINGKAQMAYVGEKPWHGLGVELQEGATPKEMMVAAGLDWSVEKRDNYFKDSKGQFKPTGQCSLIRSTDQRVLTQIGENWNPVQNIEAFNFFNEFCNTGSMQMHTAGSLRDGQIVWALAKVKSDFELFNGDKVEGFLLFSNPHMFGKAIDIRFTPIRVVCNNTLTLAISEKAKNAVKINHRAEFDPVAVKVVLGLADEMMLNYRKTAEFLGSKQITDAKFKEFLGKVFGQSKKDGKLTHTAQMAYDILETQPGHEFAKGSWWQSVNAVTYTTDHLLSRSADTRLTNAWFGQVQKKKVEAIKIALEMAGV